MTLFPTGIEIFKDRRDEFSRDPFSRARGALHNKLAEISCPSKIFALPREVLFEQVGFVVDELMEHEDYGLSGKEQTILSRVLAYDLMESQGRQALIGQMIN